MDIFTIFAFLSAVVLLALYLYILVVDDKKLEKVKDYLFVYLNKGLRVDDQKNIEHLVGVKPTNIRR